MIGMIICGGCLLLLGSMVPGWAGVGLILLGAYILVAAFARDRYKV